MIGRAPGVIDIERAFARKALQNPTDEFAGRFRACAKIHLTHYGQRLGGTNARSQETDAGLLAVISYPAFAVDDQELIDKTRETLVEKLQVTPIDSYIGFSTKTSHH